MLGGRNILLVGALENILGKSKPTSKGNIAVHCPFCHHRKPKLEIRVVDAPDGSNPWECWVCQTKGRTIRSLVRQLKLSSVEARAVLQYVTRGEGTLDIPKTFVKLPEEYQALHLASDTSVIARAVKGYLYRRGLTDDDFIKYDIGYCVRGPYAGRVIVPSYNENNCLNYFVARSYEPDAYMKYKNPDVSKDIIFWENLINWNEPIILCEGVFDALAIRRNCIPLLGKNISKALMKKILTSPCPDIYIALDRDALQQALDHCEKFLSIGKRVFFIEPSEKDPSDEGFYNFTRQLQQAEELDFETLVRYRLEL